MTITSGLRAARERVGGGGAGSGWIASRGLRGVGRGGRGPRAFGVVKSSSLMTATIPPAAGL